MANEGTDEGSALGSVRGFVLWAAFELLSGGILWATGLISPLLMIVLGVLGLAGVYAFDIGRRRMVIGSAILAALSVGLAAYLKKPEAPPPAPPQIAATKPKPDPHGLCFVDFKVWHHDQKIAITAVNINQNKQTVMTTLIGRHFTLNGFPKPPEPESDESKPLYPEQRTVAYDSAVISLGKDIPKGTVLMGRVYFLIRYGPTVDNTVALKIKGTVPIKVGALKNGGDAAFWTPDKDSTPDCPGVENLIGQNWISASQPS